MKTFLNTTDKGEFTAYVPLELNKNGKVNIIEKKQKNADGEEVIVKHVRGEASNTKIDKANERVHPDFIKKMRESVKGLNVFCEHEHHIIKTLGYIADTGGSDESLVIDTALESEDENPLVKSIVNKMKHGTKMFYSIAGKVTKASKEVLEKTKTEIKNLLDGEIYEISITALPEGNVGFLEPIMKSFKEFLAEVKDDDLTNEQVSDATEKTMKALSEMAQRSGLDKELSDLFWEFKIAVSNITYSDLTPKEKKDKIVSLGEEYGVIVEEISTKIAELTEEIESELN